MSNSSIMFDYSWYRRWPLLLILTALFMSVILAAAPSAYARSGYAGDFTTRYPSSQSLNNVDNGTGKTCQLCHEASNGGNGWNAYGWAMRDRIVNFSETTDQALANVESQDSDNDPTNSTNLAEINADTQPGWTPGANNTLYYKDGSTTGSQNPPSGILGALDPGGTTSTSTSTTSTTLDPSIPVDLQPGGSCFDCHGDLWTGYDWGTSSYTTWEDINQRMADKGCAIVDINAVNDYLNANEPPPPPPQQQQQQQQQPLPRPRLLFHRRPPLPRPRLLFHQPPRPQAPAPPLLTPAYRSISSPVAPALPATATGIPATIGARASTRIGKT